MYVWKFYLFLIGIYITYKVNTFNLSLRGVVISMKPYLLIDELNYYHETLCYTQLDLF